MGEWRSSWLHSRSWIEIKILFCFPDGVLKYETLFDFTCDLPSFEAVRFHSEQIFVKIVFFNQCRCCERKFSGVGAEDKCFIEFNYVEMLLMSCVYKQRRAPAIKSWKISRRALSSLLKTHSVQTLIDFCFDGTEWSSLKVCALTKQLWASECSFWASWWCKVTIN